MSRSPGFFRSGLFVFLLLGILTGARAATPGDLNGDGTLTVADVTFALQVATGLQEATPDRLAVADVTPNPGMDGRAIGDGKINVADVILLLQVVVGLQPPDKLLPAGGTTLPTLQLDTQALQTALNAGTAADVPVPLLFLNASNITVGKVSLTLTPQSTSPALAITQVDRGSLTQTAFAFSTNPEQIPPEGSNSVLVGFLQFNGITGSDSIAKFTVRVPANLPSGSSYRLSLGDLDFSDKDSQKVEPAVADVTLTRS